MRARRIAVGVFAFVAAGCGDDPQLRAVRSSVAGGVDRDDVVHELRAIGYTDFSDADPGEDADGVTWIDRGASEPGYNLYCVRPFCAARLIDADGRVVHEWSRPGRFWSAVRLGPDGDLFVIGADDEGRGSSYEGRFLMRLAWNGGVVWKQYGNFHHDVAFTPDGALSVLVFQNRRIPALDGEFPIRDDQIVRMSLDGDELERASLCDALLANPAAFTFEHCRPVEKNATTFVDATHTNSIDWMTVDGAERALVCMRHQNSIAILDWPARRAIWSWGRGELSGPHDASWLANGNVLVFDNGLVRGASRVVEVDPSTGEIVWQYAAPEERDLFTHVMGSSQRLPGGNTLFAESTRGRAFEVTPAGDVVWKFVNPLRNRSGQVATIVRMVRYPQATVRELLAEHNDAR